MAESFISTNGVIRTMIEEYLIASGIALNLLIIVKLLDKILTYFMNIYCKN